MPSNSLRDSKRLQVYPYFSPPPSITTEPNCDGAPSIHIQYADVEPNTDSEYPPPSDYTHQPQLDHLYAYRSGASDSGSECYSPSSLSSPSSSPFIGGQSPDPQFSNFNADPDQLSLDYHPKETSLGFYNIQQPSDFSLSEMSLSSFPESLAGPSSRPPVHPVYDHSYMTPFPRPSTSMPDILDMTPETHLDTPGILQPGLRRSASTSSASLFEPSPRNETVHNQGFFYSAEYIQDVQGISPLPRSTSPDSAIMNIIQELIDPELLDGEPHDVHELLKTTPAHPRRLVKAPKNTVATVAGRRASEKRRKHPSKFHCMIKDCPSSFTRKLGLRNHLKSHFGIADQLCQYCKTLLPNSLARHEKRCKQNPDRETSSKKTTSNVSPSM